MSVTNHQVARSRGRVHAERGGYRAVPAESIAGRVDSMWTDVHGTVHVRLRSGEVVVMDVGRRARP